LEINGDFISLNCEAPSPGQKLKIIAVCLAKRVEGKTLIDALLGW
jgi:hypothetical protein